MSKLPITITLYVSEILFDIQNRSYLTGRSIGAEGKKTFEQVSDMEACEDEEDMAQILRSIGNAYEAIKTRLSEYIDASAVDADNILIDENTKTLTIVLRMPTNYNFSMTGPITTFIHQFVVCSAIADWFSLTNKEGAEDYVKMAAVNVEQINEAIHKRVRPRRGKNSNGPVCATPVFGEDGQYITITCTTEGAVIRYTTDGSTPTKDSAVYENHLSVSAGYTIKAYASHKGMYNSPVVSYLVTD